MRYLEITVVVVVSGDTKNTSVYLTEPITYSLPKSRKVPEGIVSLERLISIAKKRKNYFLQLIQFEIEVQFIIDFVILN